MAVTLDNNTVEKQEKSQEKGIKFGKRHVQVMLLFVLLVIGYTTRYNMSIAVVAMTDGTTSSNPNIPSFTWTNTSVILSSFFWGYLSCQLLAAHVGKKYGPKWFLLVAMFVNSTSELFTPLVAVKFGSTGVIVCRIIQGLSQGFFFPSCHTLLGKWAPTEERSWMGAITYSGPSLGIVIANIVTGLMSSSWGGWPSSFYLFSALGYCWCIFWYFFGFDSPASHPKISSKEKKHIQISLDQIDSKQELTVPWKAILTSKAHWAIIIAQAGVSWGTTTLATEVPTYLKHVMDFNMNSNALISAFPIAGGIPFGLFCGGLSDYLIVKRIWPRVTVRKAFQAWGGFIAAGCLVFLSVLPDGRPGIVVALLTLSQVFWTAISCGCTINQIDLSPNFSGILMGISNSISQAVAVFAPLLVQFAVTDVTDSSQWKIVFLTSALVLGVSTLIFVLFAAAERQWWDLEAKCPEKVLKTGKK